MKFIISAILIAASSAASAQTNAASQAKLVPYYQQQRNSALDNLASCAAAVTDLQNKIADLEKQLSDAKAAQSK
jgi:uncharacterized protein YlxW (UPF0749 family)